MASAEEKSAQNEGVEDLSAAAELKDQQRPTLKATRKATRGKRTQDPPESESPDPNEADLPTENAAAVEGKVKVAVAKPAADGVPPAFTTRLCSLKVKEGEPAELCVSVTGEPQPLVTWFKDNHEIVDTSVYKFLAGGGRLVLKIGKATVDMSGVYRVEATNEFGSVDCSCEVTVEKDIEIPKFTLKLKPVTVDENDKVELKVGVTGLPPPKVIWFKDGRELKDSSKYKFYTGTKKSILVIQGATAECSGVYSAKAVNDHGAAYCSCKVSVQEEDGVANCEEVEDDDYEDEPSRLLEAALAMMASLWGYLKAGVTRLAGACRAAGSRLAGLVGLLTYLAVLYGAGYYLAEPYSKKEIPDLASKLLVGLHAGVWLFMPLILGMLLRGQLRPAGGQLFPLLCLMTLNLCVLAASLLPEEIHWVLVTARTLAVFEMVKLVSELVKLPYLVCILGHPLQFSVPLLFLYNLYHLVMMDLGFHQPEEPDVGTEQGTSSGWF